MTPSTARDKQPWQALLLTWLNAFGAALAAATVILVAKLAYEGFKAGEMGIMVGILLLAALCILMPWFVVKTIVAVGLFRRRRWALVLSLVFTCIGLAASFLAFTAGPLFFLAAFTYLALTLYLEIVCLIHPSFRAKAG
jgi:hypothetical protein